MSFYYDTSSLFEGSTASEAATEVAEYIGSIPGLRMIYPTSGLSGTFSRALFQYMDGRLGIDLVLSGSLLSLKASHSVYVKSSGNPYATAVSGETGIYSLSIHKVTENSVTKYTIGAWYGITGKNGLVVGLYTDNPDKPCIRYPVYFGYTENQFSGEQMCYVCQLNRGSYAKTGEDIVTPSSLGSASYAGMSNGMAEMIIRQNSMIYKNYPLLMQHWHQSTSEIALNQIFYSPLYAALTNKTWQAFQIDDFFAGAFHPDNRRELLQAISVGGQRFMPLSYDGVAVKL